MVMPMPSHPLNPQQEYLQSLDRLKAHQLLTEEQLLERVQCQQDGERRKLVAALLCEGAALAAILVGIWHFWGQRPELIAALVVGSLLLIGIISANLISYFKRLNQGRKAFHCLEQQDYENKEVVHYLVCWSGNYKPIKPQDWYWKSLSENVAPYPELSRVWAKWLLSEAPIREADAQLLESVIRAHKKSYEWAERKSHSEDEQRQMRAIALESLPPEVVAQVKEEQLDMALGTPDLAQEAPPKRF